MNINYRINPVIILVVLSLLLGVTSWAQTSSDDFPFRPESEYQEMGKTAYSLSLIHI